jgi:hypothetical protein
MRVLRIFILLNREEDIFCFYYKQKGLAIRTSVILLPAGACVSRVPHRYPASTEAGLFLNHKDSEFRVKKKYRFS